MEGQLTPQQHNLLKNLVKGMNLTQAAIAAGYSEKNAPVLANQALKRLRKKMPQLLDRRGLTDDALIKKYLKPALEATSTRRVTHIYQEVEGKTEEIVEEQQEPNWDARLRALDMTFKLKGSYAPTNVEHTGNIVHEITAIEQKMAQGSLEKIRALQSEAENPILAEVVDTPDNQ
jgi:phage terminase small subunit